MHPDTLSVYEIKFELLVRKSRGDAYQDLFSTIMELAYPGDFIRTRPWGNVGDRKNDGYIRSQRHLFQVYAPNEFTASLAISKIEEDFAGALIHWEEHFNNWSFVHNCYDGIGPQVEEKLLTLGNSNQGIHFSNLGPSELHTLLFSLPDDKIARVLGPAYTPTRPAQVTFEEIRHVLEQLDVSSSEANAPVLEVPADKLSANGLNHNTRHLIKLGFGLAARVGDFLNHYRFDPELGTKVANLIRAEYLTLKESGANPNIIYSQLFDFVKGHQGASEAASLGILAYFFERCDIFEPSAV